MSNAEFKNSWDEAVRRATLAPQSESELADPVLAKAAGLPTRSGLRAGDYIAYVPGNIEYTIGGYPVGCLYTAGRGAA